MTTNEYPADTDPEQSSRFPSWLKWSALGLGALIVAAVGVFIWYVAFRDVEEALDEDDLTEALAVDEAATDPTDPPDPPDPTDAPAPTTEAPPATQPEATTPVSEAPATTVAPSGTDATVPVEVDGVSVWQVTDASELGYRVTEVLFGVDTEGVGRTNQIEGALTIEETTVTTAEFVVDVASIESDDSRRDNQFRGRIMSTDEFPEAVFTLTEPIELGTEAVEGATVETSATGELTLRGVTNPVTFDISARLENGRIGVLGNIPVVFADYDIANPSVPGITTEDDGLLEFVLVFEPVA